MNRATTNLRALTLSSVLLAMTLAGCRTTRSAAAKADKAVAEALSEAEYVQQVGRLSTPDYRTLTATMYVELNPDTKDEMSSRARLKIIRGRCLQISITPLVGIELFRLEVSRDSVKIIDRMGRRYAAEPIDEIKKQIPAYAKADFPYDFHYEHLEALLTDRLFTPDGEAFSMDRFQQQRLLLGARRFRAKDTERMTYDFTTDSRARLIATEIIFPFLELKWNYSRFQTVGGRPFPLYMEAEVEGVNKLRIRFDKVETDVPVEMFFPIPDNYKRITLKQLWRMISL